MALRFFVVLCLCVLRASSHQERGMEGGVVYQGGYLDTVRVQEIGHLSRRPRQNEPNTNANSSDNHDYYTSTFVPPGQAADELWLDIKDEVNVTRIYESQISDKHRFLEVVELPFDFPYYGHILTFISVTTGGFLYTGQYLHPHITLVQYIAPLQADFAANVSDNSSILIYSSPERFTVQWDMIHNHDHVENGTFTFQVSLFPDGEIHYAYREIPLLVGEIDDNDHPVQVGLADAYYIEVPYFDPIEGPLLLVYIFTYHRVELNFTDDLAYSGYIIKPLPNCIAASSCGECINVSETSDFECGWCSNLDRCSDGFDRHRQEWFGAGCTEDATTECGELNPTSTGELIPTSTSGLIPTPTSGPRVDTQEGSKSGGLSGGAQGGIVVGILVILVVIVVVMAACAVLVYGYRRPTSRVGLFMIEHRPKARSLNKTKTSASYDVETSKAALEEQ